MHTQLVVTFNMIHKNIVQKIVFYLHLTLLSQGTVVRECDLRHCSFFAILFYSDEDD